MKSIRIALVANLEKPDIFLTAAPEFTVTGRFEHPQQLKEQAGNIRYDVIVVDTMLPGINTLDAIQMLLDCCPHAKIIAVCPYSDGDLTRQLLHMGVTGILLEHEFTGNYTHFIRAVYANRVVISPVMLSALLTY